MDVDRIEWLNDFKSRAWNNTLALVVYNQFFLAIIANLALWFYPVIYTIFLFPNYSADSLKLGFYAF